MTMLFHDQYRKMVTILMAMRHSYKIMVPEKYFARQGIYRLVSCRMDKGFNNLNTIKYYPSANASNIRDIRKIFYRNVRNEIFDFHIWRLINNVARVTIDKCKHGIHEKYPGDIVKASDVKTPAEKKRKSIPAKIRQMTWRKYIGNSMDGICWSCGDNISFENWHAGHVVPVSNNGENTVSNLRPLCSSCNLSMRETPMYEFIHKYGMTGPGADEFAEKF
jgi:hypothetical protein